MKLNYKNWIPKGMILGTLGGAVASLVLFLVFGVNGLLAAGTLKTILKIVFLVLAIALALIALWILLLHRVFSYDGKRQMSKQIIEGLSQHVTLPEGGKGLDVGCGSGALLPSPSATRKLEWSASTDGARNTPPTTRRFAKKTQRPKGWTTALLSPKAMR